MLTTLFLFCVFQVDIVGLLETVKALALAAC